MEAPEGERVRMVAVKEKEGVVMVVDGACTPLGMEEAVEMELAAPTCIALLCVVPYPSDCAAHWY